jgi:hypothetical protein
MRDTQIGSNSTHMIFNTGSGILDIGSGTVVGGGGIRINQSNNVEISGSLELNANTHITASGNISASGDTILNTVQLTNITASGNISSSNQIKAKHLILPQSAVGSIAAGGISFGAPSDNVGHIYDDSDRLTLGYNDTDIVTIHDVEDSTGAVRITKNLKVDSHITASGNISASGEIQASVFKGSLVNIDGFSAIDTSTSPERIVYGNTTTETRLIGDGGGFLHISESNVGIGTTFPPEKLTVAGNISS